MNQIKRFIKYTTIFYAIIALVYWVFIRPVHINWGATPAEVNMTIPGGDSVSSNRIVSTHAININANSSADTILYMDVLKLH